MLPEVLKLRQKCQDAVNSHDLSCVLGGYDTNAVFKGTMNAQFADSTDSVSAYFKKIFADDVSVVFIGTPTIRQFDNLYIDYGVYEFHMKGKTVLANYTFV